MNMKDLFEQLNKQRLDNVKMYDGFKVKANAIFNEEYKSITREDMTMNGTMNVLDRYVDKIYDLTNRDSMVSMEMNKLTYSLIKNLATSFIRKEAFEIDDIIFEQMYKIFEKCDKKDYNYMILIKEAISNLYNYIGASEDDFDKLNNYFENKYGDNSHNDSYFSESSDEIVTETFDIVHNLGNTRELENILENKVNMEMEDLFQLYIINKEYSINIYDKSKIKLIEKNKNVEKILNETSSSLLMNILTGDAVLDFLYENGYEIFNGKNFILTDYDYYVVNIGNYKMNNEVYSSSQTGYISIFEDANDVCFFVKDKKDKFYIMKFDGQCFSRRPLTHMICEEAITKEMTTEGLIKGLGKVLYSIPNNNEDDVYSESFGSIGTEDISGTEKLFSLFNTLGNIRLNENYNSGGEGFKFVADKFNIEYRKILKERPLFDFISAYKESAYGILTTNLTKETDAGMRKLLTEIIRI